MAAAPAFSDYIGNTYVMGYNTFVADRGMIQSLAPVLASKVPSGALDEELFDDLMYKSLLKCLAKHESSFNQRARGKDGEIGMLQFMPATFRMYCKGSIYSAEDQLFCADDMLKNDWKNIQHWKATAKFCL